MSQAGALPISSYPTATFLSIPHHRSTSQHPVSTRHSAEFFFPDGFPLRPRQMQRQTTTTKYHGKDVGPSIISTDAYVHHSNLDHFTRHSLAPQPRPRQPVAIRTHGGADNVAGGGALVSYMKTTGRTGRNGIWQHEGHVHSRRSSRSHTIAYI